MNHSFIDSELDKFEKAEKDNFSQKTTMWQAIIDDSALSDKTIEKMHTVFIPQWESDLKYLKAKKAATNEIEKSIFERFGGNLGNIPKRYYPLYQNVKDTGFIVSDLIYFVELNLKIKEKTIGAIQNKDVVSVVRGANDEDRISLIRSWYDEKLYTLLEEYKVVFEAFKKAVEWESIQAQ